jgi:hypothetical protein
MSIGFLDRFRPRTAAALPLVFHGPAQVRAYWEGLRQGSDLPFRASVDPRGLTGVLDRVFLAERIGKGLAQVSIGGSALAELAGADLRGLPLSCIFAPESRPVLAEAVEQVFAGPALAEIDLGSDRGRNGQAIARLVLMPLQDEGGRMQVLGVIGLAEGLRPCKLQVLARRTERLFLPQPEPTRGAGPVQRHGHLRLVAFDA